MRAQHRRTKHQIYPFKVKRRGSPRYTGRVARVPPKRRRFGAWGNHETVPFRTLPFFRKPQRKKHILSFSLSCPTIGLLPPPVAPPSHLVAGEAERWALAPFLSPYEGKVLALRTPERRRPLFLLPVWIRQRKRGSYDDLSPGVQVPVACEGVRRGLLTAVAGWCVWWG
ncbi:hypothetical protein EPI10_002236 [Gossypium australe]|uniref:Uncharacterized protein n=1 Tax=Gossypium australe TaxID=47621 RepID=A0A5B6VDJ2_9ROSI|nr:hypothetical protein EPI10_002236 [Gossypium australe]